MDILTLVLMLVASVLGSALMANIVSKFDRKKVRYALFVGLFLLATPILIRAPNTKFPTTAITSLPPRNPFS